MYGTINGYQFAFSRFQQHFVAASNELGNCVLPTKEMLIVALIDKTGASREEVTSVVESIEPYI